MAQKSLSPVPEGMHTITTHLWFNGNCADAIQFYQKAFNAELIGQAVPGPDGKSIMHAMLKFGDSNIMMADAWPESWETGPENNATSGLWVFLEDSDAAFAQAVEAGCEVQMPMNDAFWGDRFGKVKDPFGHCWAVATHQWDYTPEEIAERQQEIEWT
ncbi:MAG: glyoxalase/bleomycin resistance/extradiol dioxygenase family protein [Deltaproteobacteria bacterium]|jgi:PhnB protein|nr:glyoxalase/bleomycin resistance/extradiol dioxygenase family protein [Deltaproteobacteria bacterium]MBT4268990.1 glyoxalase/bleomycin resistance/extradiol dioxygenase family protein [Deltaproteobacteria bacterium]MBT4637964.1 glyoxalase/bleomycin resistance/extradiol dioxygenase family protein [Deltaproteobacteria bacterium]MBT6611987.1 glyoxalase/bleomycin resistance/extradiol dioxygenase family protein [Deltaproteobacteria bacterium]MBT7155772.1 glyoxalase/bleomycin resistance/extradiol di